MMTPSLTDIRIGSLTESFPLPLLVEAIAPLDLLDWANDHQDWIASQLQSYGALLFRHFQVGGVARFEQVIQTLAGDLIPYHDRATPRRLVSGRVYTSTEYSPSHRIFLHNENSFTYRFPQRIFFYCLTPADHGGETTIADVQKVFQRISPETREKFRQKQVMYVRNLGEGFGLPWQTVFNTVDKAELEASCQQAEITVEWRNENHLRLRQVRPAIAIHPQTNQPLWFNHAAVLHVSTLEPQRCQNILAEFPREDLPNNTYYGDGSEIEPEVLDEIRTAYTQEETRVSWYAGDVLMLDNLRIAHGREPFTGQREIVVGMAQPFTWREWLDYLPDDDSSSSTPQDLTTVLEASSPAIADPPSPDIVAPQTPLEIVLAGIWSEYLRIDTIGIHDNFYELGGQSLEAMDIIAAVQETFEVELPLRALFYTPTIATLADSLLKDLQERQRIEKLAELVLQVSQLSDDAVDELLHPSQSQS